MTAQHTRTFAAEPLQEQIIPLSEEFIQSLTVRAGAPLLSPGGGARHPHGKERVDFLPLQIPRAGGFWPSR